MQYLSNDIVSHIGSFLSLEDRRRCLETSQNFQLVTSQFVYHKLKFNNGNVNERLKRLSNTIKYLHKIKPKVKEIDCIFDNISVCDPPVKDETGNISSGIIDDQNVMVHIDALSSAKEEVVSSILSWFGPNVKINIITKLAKGNETYLQMPSLNGLKTFITGSDTHKVMQKISHIPELSLQCANCPAITFEHIDVVINKRLYVYTYDTDIRIHNFYKITVLHFGKTFINGYDKLHQSILESKQQEHLQPFRLELVGIDDGICQDMLQCLKLLPPTCMYIIVPLASSVMWDIAQLKGRTIRYSCPTRVEYLRAMLLKISHRECDFPIHFGGYTPTSDDSFPTVHEIYNAMSEADQKEWYGVYVLGQCCGV